MNIKQDLLFTCSAGSGAGAESQRDLLNNDDFIDLEIGPPTSKHLPAAANQHQPSSALDSQQCELAPDNNPAGSRAGPAHSTGLPLREGTRLIPPAAEPEPPSELRQARQGSALHSNAIDPYTFCGSDSTHSSQAPHQAPKVSCWNGRQPILASGLVAVHPRSAVLPDCIHARQHSRSQGAMLNRSH